MGTNSRKRSRVEYDYEVDRDYTSEEDEDYELLKKMDKEAYNIFKKTRKEILNREPNIMKILKEPLLMNDRINLLQMYEIYKNSDEHTEQWLELLNKVNNLFEISKNNYRQYKKYTKKQHIDMQKQINILNEYNMDTDLKYRILQLDTSIDNKQIIYSKYKELRSMSSNDEEKAKLTNWLNWAITIPHDKIKTYPLSNNDLSPLKRLL